MCDDVSEIASQKETIVYEHDGKAHKYTADIHITTPTEKILLEVKTLPHLIKSKSLDKYLVIARWFQTQQRKFEFVAADQINLTWFENAFFLRRYLNLRSDFPAKAEVFDRLTVGAMAMGELFQALQDRCLPAQIFVLIAHRELCFDWDVALSRNSKISLPNQSYERMTYARTRSSTRHAGLLAQLAVGCRPEDRQLLAAKSARRWAPTGINPFGFVGGLSAAQLGHSRRKSTSRTHQPPASSTTTANDSGT